MKKTAVLTTWYPSVEPYLEKFITSINNQTDKNFSLIILNNRFLNSKKFKKKINKKINVIEIFSRLNNITTNRKKLIKFAIKMQFENLIFSDSDDYFTKNRIFLTKKNLRNNDIVVNQILIKKNKRNPIKFIKENIIKSIKEKKFDLTKSNIFGLSNTALKSQHVKKIIGQINKNVKIFDWFFWILIKPLKKSVIFEKKIKTFYNLHGDNQTFTYSKMNNNNYLDLLKIRKKNFFYLQKTNRFYFKYYLEEKKNYQEIENKVKLSKMKIPEVINYNKNYKKKLWWEK